VIRPANIAVPGLNRSSITIGLTTAEGKALIDQIADLRVPISVLTGGDPLKRRSVRSDPLRLRQRREGGRNAKRHTVADARIHFQK
jgi:hypothetical protein